MSILKEIEHSVVSDKLNGMTDVEIGKKYKINYRQIENILRKTTGLNISTLKKKSKPKTFRPKDFREERTTVWSFKNRGNWATHSGEYRGNWSPYIPRNVILRYSQPNELVLDYFCGAGTTAVEAKLLGRRCIAIDINEKAIELARENVNFNILLTENPVYEPDLYVGDARNLSFIPNNSVDLICTHPPYANIIQYTDNKDGDLSIFKREHFLKEMHYVARESYRVLKAGKKCAILIGDMRSQRHVIPLGFELIDVYLKSGFRLKELIIKRQHNCKTTGFWYKNSIQYNFLLLAHEYLPIFEKPEEEHVDLSRCAEQDLGFINKEICLSESLTTLETTTVWAFPLENLENSLDSNVISRYALKNQYIAIEPSFESSNYNYQITPDGFLGLLYIKKPPFCGENYISQNLLTGYLKGIKRTIVSLMPFILKDGYCVVQTMDVRVGPYIQTLAKDIVDMLKDIGNLQLKEIIIVTSESNRPTGEYLEITHQYLLVYRKVI